MPLTQERTAELNGLCRKFRVDVLKAIHGIQSGHPGGSLSVCEILTLLYQEIMNIDAEKADDPDRDRLVLCKGHAAPMLYRNLIEKGFLPADSMSTLRRIDSILQGHPSNHTPGVEMPSGPLGIGLSAAQGMAIGLKLNNSPARVYAVMGDGELDEGAHVGGRLDEVGARDQLEAGDLREPFTDERSVSGRGVDPGPDRGGAHVDLSKERRRLAKPLDVLTQGHAVGAELLAERHRDRVLELGASHLDDVGELLGLR